MLHKENQGVTFETFLPHNSLKDVIISNTARHYSTYVDLFLIM